MAAIKKRTNAKKPASKDLETRKNFFTKRNSIIILIVIIAGVLIYFFKGLFIAATVNGQPVSRLELVQQLEKQAGKTTLESLVTKKLILQEMKKKNITVTDAEVNAEIKKIEDALKQQKRTLDEALSQQGITRGDLAEQVKIQKMVEKLLTKEAVVTEKDIDKYLEENKDSIPEGQDEKSIRDSAKEQLRQQKLASEFQKWLTGIQSKAKIQYYVSF